MRTVAFCENHPKRQTLLRQRWPGVPVYGDVREFHPPTTDVVCGGFPCQDLSRAGRRAGINGERSGLWREFVRVVAESGSPWVVMENIHQGWREWVPVLRGALHELGYASVPLQMRAVDFGLPHRRSRVFLVAHADREHLQQQRGRSRGPSRESSLLLRRLGEAWRAARPSSRITFPRVDRAGDGLSFELDLIRRIEDETSNDPQKVSEAQGSIRAILRYVWEHQETATASPQLYRRGLLDCVPGMPHQNPHGGWLLGKRIKEDQGLRDLWQAFCDAPQHKEQDMQPRLLERAREKKRPETLGTREDRNSALGNAIVPYCAELIGRAIMTLEDA